MLQDKEFITLQLISMAWLFWPLAFACLFTLIYIRRSNNLWRLFATVTFIGFGVYGFLRTFALGAEVLSDLISAFGFENGPVHYFLYTLVDGGGQIGMGVAAVCTLILSQYYISKFLLLPGLASKKKKATEVKASKSKASTSETGKGKASATLLGAFKAGAAKPPARKVAVSKARTSEAAKGKASATLLGAFKAGAAEPPARKVAVNKARTSKVSKSKVSKSKVSKSKVSKSKVGR